MTSAARVAVLAVAACLLALLAGPVVPVSAAPATSAPAAAVAPPGDFPTLPRTCSDDRGVVRIPCRVTRFPGRPTLVLWGDSHATMYSGVLRRLAQRHRVNLLVVVYGGCPVSTPYADERHHRRTGCDDHNDAAFRFVRDLTRRLPRVRILVGGFWAGYRQGYALMERERRTGVPSGLTPYRQQMARLAVERARPMFRRIGRLGVPVDLIGQAAAVPLDPPECAAGREPYRCDLPRTLALRDEAGNRAWLQRNLASQLPGRPRIIDTSTRYCTRTTCAAQVGGVPTFYDDIHLGARMTATMGAWFRPVFQDLLAR